MPFQHREENLDMLRALIDAYEAVGEDDQSPEAVETREALVREIGNYEAYTVLSP